MENITYELCPHCENEVKLKNELNVQVCPECGKHIVVCSMCLDYHCSNCKLEHLANKLNEMQT
jgi:predicted RNA-binding Zn-ribbon protein involved in translation (DUF1610 family)